VRPTLMFHARFRWMHGVFGRAAPV